MCAGHSVSADYVILFLHGSDEIQYRRSRIPQPPIPIWFTFYVLPSSMLLRMTIAGLQPVTGVQQLRDFLLEFVMRPALGCP